MLLSLFQWSLCDTVVFIYASRLIDRFFFFFFSDDIPFHSQYGDEYVEIQY